MSFNEIFYDTNDRVLDMLNEEYEETNQIERFGLDPRSAYILFVSEEGIVVHANQDRLLQYYGGFEYVDKEYRLTLGDWVFYSADSDRVRECLNRYHDRLPEYEDEEEEENV